MEKAAGSFKFLSRLSSKTVPDELTTLLVFNYCTSFAISSSACHGKPLVAIDVCYDGSISKGELLLKPLRKFTEPIVDLIQPMPYPFHQSLNDPLEPAGFQNYWKSLYFDELSDEALNMIDFYCNSVNIPAFKDCHSPTWRSHRNTSEKMRRPISQESKFCIRYRV